MMELRFVVGSIDETNLTIANLILKLHRVLIDQNNSIVGCVCYSDEISIQASLLFDADNLAWVP